MLFVSVDVAVFFLNKNDQQKIKKRLYNDT